MTYKANVIDIVFRNDKNGWTVASVEEETMGLTSAVGVMPLLSAGDYAIFEAEQVNHPDYGEQLKVSRYEVRRPDSLEGIERYLGSGIIKGVGPRTARRIVDYFGREVLDILATEPERLTELPGIGKARVRQIAESFAEQNERRSALIFLQGLGLSAALSVKVFQEYGEFTEAIVRGNPYRMADEIDGVGFRIADGIAMVMGGTAENSFRLRSGLKFVLQDAAAAMGHVYLPADQLCDRAQDLLQVERELVNHTIAEMLMDGSLIREDADGEVRAYLPRYYSAEVECAERLTELLREARSDETAYRLPERLARAEREQGIELDPVQREAVEAAATEGVVVITGGPGTGKTTCIKCMIELLKPMCKIELAAPTGRAAKRMSEATGRPARTIHRLLEYAGDSEGFGRDEDVPLEADCIIVDEVSMVDIFLMRALLRAIKPGSRLILVGDADQLPSVGAGNVLHDVIDSGFCRTVRLTEVFRQAQESAIVMNAHRINRGEYPAFNAKGTDFFIVRSPTAEGAAKATEELVKKRLPSYLGVDPLSDIQVLSPMKRGGVGVYELSRRLQAALNPPRPGSAELHRGDAVFRTGDKVMQIKNNYDIEWTRDWESGKGIFNGDIGFVSEVNPDDGEMTVIFDDGREAKYDLDMAEELESAYCISVHKSQGSEFEAVVLPLISGSRLLMTRNLLYTAVTRARRLCVIVGREDAVRSMVDNNHVIRRYSALNEKLKEINPE